MKLARFPVANCLILNSFKSSVGYFCRNSTNITAMKNTSPPARIAILRPEVGFPTVKASRIVDSPMQYKY